MKLKKILPALFVSLLIPYISGCSDEEPTFDPNYQIEFATAIPLAYLNEEYNFEPYIVMEKGYEYSLSACYQNYYTLEDVNLEVNGFKFTPIEQYKIAVTVTATLNDFSTERRTTLDVGIKPDKIDELLSDGGYSGWADAGFIKEATVEEDKLCPDVEGVSSIRVTYNGNNPWTWGGQMLCINNFRCLDYWEDKTWENAIVRFYCYNPTDYNFRFQLRVWDKLTNLVNVDWTQSNEDEQVAEPGKWSLIRFSLKKLGVNHPLFVNEDGDRDDSLTIKTRWDGCPEGEITPLYNFQMYIDGIDIVSAETYPDFDTRNRSKAETETQGLENCFLDSSKTKGWGVADVHYDRDIVRTVEFDSKSSAYCEFKDTVIPSNAQNVKYAFCLNIQDSVKTNGLTPLNLTHGILTADFKFNESITDTDIKFFAVDDTWEYCGTKYETTDLGDGWRKLTIDFAPDTNFFNIQNALRIGFTFVGVTEENKDTAAVWIDNIFFKQNEGSEALPRPEVLTSSTLENMTVDTGWNKSIVENDFVNVYSDDTHESKNSRKISFNGEDTSNKDFGYGVAFDTSDLSPKMNATKTNIKFFIRFSESITSKKISLHLVRSYNNDWERKTQSLTFGDSDLISGTDWYYLDLNLYDISKFAEFTEVIRFCISFTGVTDDNKDTAAVWIDNFTYTNVEPQVE